MNEQTGQNEQSTHKEHALSTMIRRRILMTLFGTTLCAAAVAFFRCSLFGVDPFQCFAMGLWGKFSRIASYGTFYMILSFLFLAVDLFLDRHYIGIATFINLFLTGYIVSFSQNLLEKYLLPVLPHIAAASGAEPGLTFLSRFLLLAIGLVVMCFASAFYMTADLGVSVYDAIPIYLAKKKNWQFRLVRIVADSICVLIGTIAVLTGGSGGVLPGLGTILTAFCMGPLIDFFNRKVARPLLYR